MNNLLTNCALINETKWKTTHLWSLCSSSWQSLHVSLSQDSQYSFNCSCLCTWQKKIRLSIPEDDDLRPLSVGSSSISSLGRMVWSLVIRTRWCAWMHASHSHSSQSWHQAVTAALSSQLVHTLLSVPEVASSVDVDGVAVATMKWLSIMSSRLRHSWRHIGHLAAVDIRKFKYRVIIHSTV